IMTEISEANAVPHQPRMNIRPFAPCLVADREARRVALLRRQQRQEGPRGLHYRCKRKSAIFEGEELRDESATSDTAERLRKLRMGVIEHGPQSWHQLKRADCRHRRPVAQCELGGLSCHGRGLPCAIVLVN